MGKLKRVALRRVTANSSSSGTGEKHSRDNCDGVQRVPVASPPTIRLLEDGLFFSSFLVTFLRPLLALLTFSYCLCIHQLKYINHICHK